MIKVISIDLGGVLFSEGKKVALEKLKKEQGYEPELILRLIRSRYSKLAADWRRGLVKEEDFWQWVKENLPKGYDADLIKQEWWDGYILDQGLYQLLKKLKKNYRIFAFSGNVKDRIDYLEDKYHFRELFDEEVYSFACHLLKRDKEFYQELIKKAGCQPEEIVHIDNQEKIFNTGGESGINFVIYKTGEIKKLKDQLFNLGININ